MYASFGTCRIYLFLDLTILNENYCNHKILLHNVYKLKSKMLLKYSTFFGS